MPRWKAEFLSPPGVLAWWAESKARARRPGFQDQSGTDHPHPESSFVKKHSGPEQSAEPFPQLYIFCGLRRVLLERGETGGGFGKPSRTASGSVGTERQGSECQHNLALDRNFKVKNESHSPQLSWKVSLRRSWAARRRGNFFTAKRLVFSPDTGSGTFQFSVVPSGPGPLQGAGTKWLNSDTCRAATVAVGRREDRE